MYSYLCDSAHSGSLGVLQIRQANTAESQRSLCQSSMTVTMIAAAYMVKAYCRLLPPSEIALSQYPDRARLVEAWTEIGRRAPEGPTQE
jgi:hypothetical protein